MTIADITRDMKALVERIAESNAVSQKQVSGAILGHSVAIAALVEGLIAKGALNREEVMFWLLQASTVLEERQSSEEARDAVAQIVRYVQRGVGKPN